LPPDPPNGQETLPPTEAEVIDPGNQVVDLGPLDEPELTEGEAEIDGEVPVPGATSPQTGKPFGLEEIVGTSLVVLGGAGLLVLFGRRRARLR
jgi:hypothetical protein